MLKGRVRLRTGAAFGPGAGMESAGIDAPRGHRSRHVALPRAVWRLGIGVWLGKRRRHRGRAQ